MEQATNVSGRTIKKIYRGLAGYALLALLLNACGGNEQQAQTQEKAEAEQAVAVEAQVIQVQTLPQQISYTGNIEPWEQALIAGQTGVRIDRIHVQEGDQVRKGQVLATMNSTQLNQAKTQLDLARRNVTRLDTLYRIGSVSGQQFDQAQTEYQNALSNYNNLAQNTRLTANFNGVITGKYFTSGEIFSPSADAPAILSMMQIDPVKVTIRVGEAYFTRVNEGMQATVLSDVYPDQEFTGQVYRKSPTIDRGSRTFQTEIRIDNKDRRLRPGMFARVTLNLGEAEGIYIPTSAVVNQQGTTNQFVYVVEGDRVRRTAVETGNRYEELIQIQSGLEAGQRIVTEGMGKLNEGSLVRIMNNPGQVSEQ
ncbi:efflux RND transporter periplasmic adaptor subunit [Pontibacter sp. SGAir0037]|uniref:efflux RND transporter periplasmic adaptor subunit n=1 Tax=Pontibacter sp. SGAir0037 TaxID=2571030 RepID=UPI0010CCE43B|nr:efflux RND transporter periplasmic adaptor subunit [Pontibacter sp. SGAir0037]QCR21248.1 efflux RND transporter periplasmic adaptor subunit [Pontibacter sp. SGAir0037]